MKGDATGASTVEDGFRRHAPMWTFSRSDLKFRLTLRVTVVTAFCFAAVSAYFVLDTESSVRARIDAIARITARTLELQQSKRQWVNPPQSAFPDLQDIASSVMIPGLCVAYRDEAGATVQRICGGQQDEKAAPPYLFAAFYRELFDPGREAVQPVLQRGAK